MLTKNFYRVRSEQILHDKNSRINGDASGEAICKFEQMFAKNAQKNGYKRLKSVKVFATVTPSDPPGCEYTVRCHFDCFTSNLGN